MRVSIHKHISNPFDFKQQLLSWSQQFREVVFLEGNSYPEQYSSFDCILAVDAFTSIKTDFHNAFEDLKQYQQTTKDWLFGYLSYDLKNDIEDLKSNNFDGLEFPDLFFFQPKKVFLLKGNELEIQYLLFCDDELEDDFNEIVESQKSKAESSASLKIQQRISKDLYVEKVNQMLHHIHIGDMYEANFCMEFYAENAVIDPQEKFRKLNEISQAPFSVFFKNNKHFLLSASPERYLKKVGETIISQPIKGTSKRAADPVEDEKSKAMLASDEKRTCREYHDN
ncbi:hypothetical protein AAFH68_52160 [Flavobacterium sp. CGRL1]